MPNALTEPSSTGQHDHHAVTKLDRLQALAERIPSMGGREIGPWLRKLARNCQAGTSVVEVGSWLGAGTAQLALGIAERQHPHEVTLHCYDRWLANGSEVAKASDFGIRLEEGENTLLRVRDVLESFGVPMVFHQGELIEFDWNDGPISLYVDDASKLPEAFVHVLQTFGASWVPGTTVVVLMDYGYWKTSGVAEHRCQQMFVEFNRHCFERLSCDNEQHAVFLYKRAFESIPTEVVSMALQQVRQRLRACHESTSWRVSAPLRAVSDTVRRLAESWRSRPG